MENYFFLLRLFCSTYFFFAMTTAKSAALLCNDNGPSRGRTPSEINSSQTQMNESERYIIVEGDIMVDRNEFQRMKENPYSNVITDVRNKWPQNTVYYSIEPYVYAQAQLDVIYAGMQDLMDRTCIRFVDAAVSQYQGHRIHITNQRSGCFSVVGYHVDPYGRQMYQEVNLHPNTCFTDPGNVEHELLHALGLGHEQSRPDRDQYVVINTYNIPPDLIPNNFDILYQTTTYGLPYDYGSVMHYASYADAIDPNIPTITAKKNTSICLGNAFRATDCDILKINMLYGCTNHLQNRRSCLPVERYPINGNCRYLP